MNSQKKKVASLESRIGLYWLHKLGIASIVFGTVFLITYSIQISNIPILEPLFKLGCGLLVSIALLFLGRRMSTRENQKWYAHGLTAAGWSLAYFTAYAAHYIPEVKVISSLPIETGLLSMVAGGSLWSALKAKSELMAIYSCSLAALTILMNGPSFFANGSFLILAITAAVLGNLQSWRKLLASSMAFCYLGNLFCCFDNQWHWAINESNSLFASTFIFSLWLTFSIGIGLIKNISDADKNHMTALACLNGAAFGAGVSLLGTQALHNLHEILFVSAGVFYLGLSKLMEMRNQEQQQTVHSLMGLFFINVAKFMQFSGLTMLAIDVFQIALLSVVGLKYNIKTFKWAGVFLTVLLGLAWSHGVGVAAPSGIVFGFNNIEYVKIAGVAGALLAGLAYLQIRTKEDGYSYFHHLASNIMFALAIVQLADPSWQACAYALLAVANVAVGIIRNSDYYAAVGIVPFVLSVILSALSVDSWLSTPMSIAIVALYATHLFGRTADQQFNPELTEQNTSSRTRRLFSRLVVREQKAEYVEAAHWLFAYMATIALTVLVLANVPTDFVSLGLGIEGLGLLGAGFLLKERFFRLSGLSVLFLLTGKLLFVDLANHNTMERILSFIAAGVVFLLSSYAYGRFTHSFEDDATSEDEEEGETITLREFNTVE